MHAARRTGLRALPRPAPPPAWVRPAWLRLLPALALVACATTTPRPAPPARKPDWDGAYHGTSTRYRAAARDCPHPGILTLYVGQAQFTYPWAWHVDIPGTIAPDGTISGGSGPIRLTGSVHGRRMEGDVSDPACGLHFTVNRRF